MIYLSQNVASLGLELRSNIDLTVKDYHVYISTTLDERDTMVTELGQ